MADRQPATARHRTGMTIEDVDILNAERDADPERWRDYGADTDRVREVYDRLHAQQRRASQQVDEPVEEAEPVQNSDNDLPLERTETQRTLSTSSGSSVNRPRVRQRQASTLSKTSTRMERDMMEYIDRHPTALGRINEHRLQHSLTVGTGREHSVAGVEMPDFGGGKSYPPALPAQEEYVVEFSGHDDPRHAQNWKVSKKIIIGVVLILDSIAATFASAVFSAATEQIEARFSVGSEVATLGTSLFVLGYAVGPVVFAPLSELYGRRVPIIIAAFGFGIFNTAVATAANFQTVLICRFFGGIFGAAPLALTAAVFSDMFDNKSRGLAVAIFSASVFCGPFCGPMIGGFVAKSYLGWRWTAWLPAFLGYAGGVAGIFFLDESYGPVILVSKAAELRRLTRNWGIHAKQEEVEVDLRELVVKNLSRPLRILFTEPIVLLVTIYMSFIYGLLYLTLTAYDLIFADVYGFSLGVEGLPYMALIVGVMIGFLVVALTNKNYVKKLEANDNIPVPEWRMPLAMPAGILFSGGLFWLGWTGNTGDVPWIVPTLAGLALGFGIYTVFLQCLNYIIDSYLMFAASAIAANTIMRSLFGAIFPLFATYMFEGIGIGPGMSLLGGVAALFIPMPFVFYFFGKRIRARSKFAPAPDIQRDKKRREQADLEAGAGAADGEAGAEGKTVQNGSSSSDEKKHE